MFTLRPATQADFIPLETLYTDRSQQAFEQMWQIMWQWQGNGRCTWLLLIKNGAIIGSGQLLLYQNKAELANLFVLASERSQGAGTQLIQALESVAKEKKFTLLELRVADTNHLAQRLYQRLGYVKRHALEINGEHLIIMQKKYDND